MWSTFDEVMLATLDKLESKELRRLSWGLTNGFMLEDEVLDAAAEVLGAATDSVEDDEEDVLAELLERRLLLKVRGGPGYRTRIAELVRLAASLKQLFQIPGWRAAPRLVADYRFRSRSRAFPDRCLGAREVVDGLLAEGCSSRQAEIATALLHADDGENAWRLASFQQRGAKEVLAALETGEHAGVLIGAGTGSGKTLAFYLPALMHVCESLAPAHHTKVLAIYPRKELLKDQFTSALKDARRLRPLLGRHGKRPILLGAYFGETPQSAKWARDGWRETGGGALVCPLLRCPECGGELLWLSEDRRARPPREALECGRCATRIGSEEIVLTRESIASRPPDFLFTTTEMLNRRMSDSVYGTVLGVDSPQPPSLVLLDEVHTYDGVHGAQVAYLLRRWRHAVGRPTVVVGLSATLRDGKRFFSRLTGVEEERIADVSPRSSELKRAGKEYILAVRGDPSSGASLLSTTIQTSMLVRRLLDPPTLGRSEGAFGSRTFLFTDDLDVTNRLYFDLLDAEGLDSWGRPLPSRADGSLANLRSASGDEVEQRREAGQVWDAVEDVGHSLRPGAPVTVGRTSSQDTGVDARSSLIVATASLEVGFDDPTVGAVIQHKAPRGAAQFLQRKGRAGRKQEMRPLTAIVLSDYGRDRHAYQSYGQLFDPVLPPNPIPLENRYVLKIQAAYVLIDWVARELKDVPPGSVWRDFSMPAPGGVLVRQASAATLLAEVVEGGPARRRFDSYLADALAVPKETCRDLLWDAPRSLLLEVIPTILRRLETSWEHECSYKDHDPIPEFVPTSLFSPLALPEVVIETPPQQVGDEPRRDLMPVLQGMLQHAPGRVSHRFTIKNRHARFWIAPPAVEGGDHRVPLDHYASRSVFVGTVVERLSDGREVARACYRPMEMNPEKPPLPVLSSSNGSYEWRSELLPEGEGVALDLPRSGRWAQLVDEVRAYTHDARQHVRVWRFASAASAEIGLSNGERHRPSFRFTDGEETVAVGFSSDVDGLRVRIRLPTDDAISGAWSGSRRAAFGRRVMNAELPENLGRFGREWLARVWFAALAERADEHRTDLSAAAKALAAGGEVRRFEAVIDAMLGAGSKKGRDVATRLGAALRLAPTRAALYDASAALWSPMDSSDAAWMRSRLKATLGAAFMAAFGSLCPEFNIADLQVDLDAGPRSFVPEAFADVWFTETTLGGGGILEAVIGRYQRDPWRFFRLVDAALTASDFEALDETLTHVCTEMVGNAQVAALVSGLRGASAERSATELRSLLLGWGFNVSQPVVVGLNTRLARAGASDSTDAYLSSVVRRWRDWEARWGVDIDAATVSFVCSGSDELDRALEETPPGGAFERTWRFGVIAGLLWPHGWENRARTLRLASTFYEPPPTDRELLSACLPKWTTVDVSRATWREEVEQQLQDRGLVHVQASAALTATLAAFIGEVLENPVVVGSVVLPVVVRGVARGGGHVRFRLEVAEVPQ